VQLLLFDRHREHVSPVLEPETMWHSSSGHCCGAALVTTTSLVLLHPNDDIEDG